MIKVAIIGASGYTGAELARILCNHPQAELTAVTSRQYAGQPLSAVFPHLRSQVDLVCNNLSADEVADLSDVTFTAVPHSTAMEIVPQLLRMGNKVIDLSADFRLRDAKIYEQWYQHHSAPTLIGQAVYGLPELYRTEIRDTQLVANPGCYPTSIILGLAPLLEAGVVDVSTIIADCKSGTSGAGRTTQLGTLFCEVTDGFKAYKVGGSHRHTPEIEQELSGLAGSAVTVSFTPHLLPISRGILSTVYASLKTGTDEATITELYQKKYGSEPFVRLLPSGTNAATQHVRGSNFCDISFAIDGRTGRIIVTSAIDNIVKGAAGQAVQNMNLMYGLPETTGLTSAPFFP